MLLFVTKHVIYVTCNTQTSFLRPNLVFKVVPKVLDRDDETSQPLCKTRLVAYIKQQQQQAAAAAAVKVEAAATGPAISGSSSSSSSSGIVYCLSRKEAEEIAAFLREVGGISAGHYHAGMTPKQRMEVRVITVL